MEDNKICVTNDAGEELEFDILFTFDSEDTGKKYVLYYDAQDEDAKVYSSIYDDEGNLYPIETPEEWEMIEEVFSSFVSQDDEEQDMDGEDEQTCCHGKNHGENHECCCHKKG